MPRPDDGRSGDRERLQHMLQAAQDAMTVARGHRREDLDTDVALQHALVHCVEQIGEAAARVSDEGRSFVGELPWTKIVGMRHILVHRYYAVDFDSVWRVVNEDVPELVLLLESALSDWK
jgi:uncharacterized protein with HEPN domain